MTTQDPAQRTIPVIGWLANQPYLLLSLTSLFWAGNVVLGRFIAGHVPPIALSFIRWSGAFLLILPFALPHLKREWPKIRSHLPILLVLSLTGIGAYNTLAYIGLQYTQALTALLIQSAGPLFVAFWSLVLFRTRLTWAQAFGIAISLAGVLTIIARGEIEALGAIDFNKGDLIFAGALMIFCIYSAIMPHRPKIHPLAFLAFTTGCGAAMLIPFVGWEISTGYTLSFDTETLLALGYVVVFPSTIAYLCYNRGVELIGANRSAPFYHLIPVFGSVLAIGFLGEEPRLYHLAGYGLVLLGVFIAARK
ncbi:DMT transporter permease [Afipia sp. P52-10]|uniref:DMT family transporter n=1 Tax=Afipia sp. P52-10 TaxID=1429916 RepID=UPI0003DF11B5|nr:DMT family transporter [Afipia sp. P52-10]ETR76995.1 DMT transporter permease [Afipia sp. P52-10]